MYLSLLVYEADVDENEAENIDPLDSSTATSTEEFLEFVKDSGYEGYKIWIKDENGRTIDYDAAEVFAAQTLSNNIVDDYYDGFSFEESVEEEIGELSYE